MFSFRKLNRGLRPIGPSPTGSNPNASATTFRFIPRRLRWLLDWFSSQHCTLHQAKIYLKPNPQTNTHTHTYKKKPTHTHIYTVFSFPSPKKCQLYECIANKFKIKAYSFVESIFLCFNISFFFVLTIMKLFYSFI